MYFNTCSLLFRIIFVLRKHYTYTQHILTLSYPLLPPLLSFSVDLSFSLSFIYILHKPRYPESSLVLFSSTRVISPHLGLEISRLGFYLRIQNQGQVFHHLPHGGSLKSKQRDINHYHNSQASITQVCLIGLDLVHKIHSWAIM